MANFILGTVIEGIFALYIIFSVSEFKSGKKISGILFWAITGIVGTAFMQICIDHNWQIAGAVSTGQFVKYIQMVIFLLFGSLFLRGGIIRTIFSIAVSDVIVTVGELLERVVYFWIIHRSMKGFYIADLTENSVLQGILLIICNLFISVFVTKIFREIRTIPFEKRWATKIFACFYVGIGFSPALKMLFTVKSDREDFFMFVVYFGCVFCGFAALLFREKNRIFQQKNLYLFLQEQMLKEHVRLMEDQIAITRKFRHDIRKHLDMVSYFVKQNPKYETSQQLEEYKSDLREMYQSLSRGDYCDLQDVNAILYQLEKFCKKNGIAFQAKLKDMDCKCMQAEDRSDIFFSVVNWGMAACKPYIEAKRKISAELSGETAAGRSVLALSVKAERNTGVHIERKKTNHTEVQDIVWLERMEKSLTKYDGFWEIENGSEGCRMMISFGKKLS